MFLIYFLMFLIITETNINNIDIFLLNTLFLIIELTDTKNILV